MSGYRGRVEAVGFVIDPAHVRDRLDARVSGAWVDGARLLVEGERLVLLLPEPVGVRAERAPGLPLRRVAGVVEAPSGAAWRPVATAALPPADLSRWLPVREVRRLTPVSGAAPSAPVATVVAPTTAPDLALMAKVVRSARAESTARELARARPTGRRIRRRGAGAAGTPRTSWVTRLALRTPVVRVVGRRHAAYLRRLTEQFEKRNWDEALATAIGLSGLGGTQSLRLPGRRLRTDRPSAAPAGGGTAVPYGPTVHQHLQELYQQAADELERQGRVLQAAYVLSDLMGRHLPAVELLERHGEHRLAAELAEGWRLEPALVVRLWWRAGERGRAVEVARQRDAFAVAIDRLQATDAALAHDLRRAWVLSRQADGDLVGAIDAAWPEVALRPLVAGDLARAVVLGGSTAGHALAHAVEIELATWAPALARELLGPAHAGSAAATGFIRTFGERRAVDPALDRELATRAALVLAVGSHLVGRAEVERLLRGYRSRADALTMADLPAPSKRRMTSNVPSVPTRGNGDPLVVDAVAVEGGAVLVALGDAGVRLLRPDGRVRARWDVPAHRIVVADHGARALLAADRGGVWTVHELDLPLGPPRLLPPLRAGAFLDTYDGRELVETTETSLRWLLPSGGKWAVTWTELEREGAQVIDCARAADALAVYFKASQGLQVWQWTLPGRRLVARGTVAPATVGGLLPNGWRAGLDLDVADDLPDDDDPLFEEVVWLTPYDVVAQRVHIDPGVSDVLGLGPGWLTTAYGDNGGVLTVYPEPGAPAAGRLLSPLGRRLPVARRWRDLVTTWSGDHVVVIDVASREVVADLVVRLDG